MALRAAEWCKLPTSLTELCINTTLRCGQSFRWRKSDDDVWSCAIHGRILSLRQDAEALHYRATFPTVPVILPTPSPSTTPSVAAEHDDTLAFINHYFNLAPNLGQLYEQWAASDANFKRRAPKFTGIRILRQDAWEALIGFICSSNNNISRISGMVHNLCLHYGPLIGHIDDVPYHDFPTPQSLCKPEVEDHLRKLGFGYRAKYIAKTARIVAEEKGGLAWLEALSNPELPQFSVESKPAGDLLEGGRDAYRKAHEELLVLQGVGPKVADCVCLFGLGWLESVPVDTHVWQIAQRDYKFGKGKHSSLTAATYVAIGNLFRKLWGKEAGWAHSVLFTADLKAFSDRTVAKTEVKEEEVVIKKEHDEIVTEASIKQETTKRKRIKKEPDENEHQVLEVEEKFTRRSKRQRA
ncbi:DNA-(apurinic or apyrimidinic site) lyase [Ascochyta rabiei]|uniref:DNA-(apurinic or apyrimidinic site) lyase n=1 Tax=Didymella rabiei TaxID=5454 RepID=A0A163LQ54_DIDRA|nr:DNA-(apurinic or apyrimidinic site) lyase [Ascochyta rabiei]KZM28003.1 damaged DNA binding [Ascochyta rabiei]UPX11428.1 DNA-(apurinic or apyrimidinic site) lyase [Ascochyta rabiei]